MARIVAQIRERWPECDSAAGDSGFTRDDLMTWCEQNDVDYLFGLAKNNRLIAEIAAELAEAAEENRQSGKPARRFKDFHYRTRRSWSRQRRVVGKAEWIIPSVAESRARRSPAQEIHQVGDIDLATLEGRANPRFVVTSLQVDQHQARALYEKLYCARGKWKTASRNVSSICSLTEPPPAPYAPTSYGFGCPLWPMS